MRTSLGPRSDLRPLRALNMLISREPLARLCHGLARALLTHCACLRDATAFARCVLAEVTRGASTCCQASFFYALLRSPRARHICNPPAAAH